VVLARHGAVIVVYNGLGTTAGARVWGRVLEDEGLTTPAAGEGRFRKLRRSWHELESDEIPHAEVTLKVLGRSYPVRADREGLFELRLPGPLPRGDHPVDASMRYPRAVRVEAGRLLVWPQTPGVAVVSDIDDTVLQTGVQNKLGMIKRVLFSNAHDLRTYDRAPRLFQVWARRGHPIVFVSGSPVNLYTRLCQFFTRRGFPVAPLLLKNLGITAGSDSLTDQRGYKLRRIRQVQALLPGYRLLLLGDSGEQDPEIYADVQRGSGAGVVGVLVHRVTAEPATSPRFRGALVFDTYAQLARELAARKLLTAAEAKEVVAAEEQGRPGAEPGRAAPREARP
jgi:phosphatidate phosphatase APP1